MDEHDSGMDRSEAFFDLESLIQSCNYEGGEEQAQQADGQNRGSARDSQARSRQQTGSANQALQKSSSQSEEEPFAIGSSYTQEQWQSGHGHWANADEQINQKDFPSVFEFLKTTRYQSKKQDKKQKFLESKPEQQQETNQQYLGGASKDKIGISAIMDQPHSIVHEVFSWDRTLSSRDQILKKGNMAEHISTPKMTGRSLQLSPASVRNVQNCPFSPMTLSRAAVRNIHGQINRPSQITMNANNQDSSQQQMRYVGSISSGLNPQTQNNARKHLLQAAAMASNNQQQQQQQPQAIQPISESKPNAPISGWPILQGYLNVREVILPTKKTVAQFKNIGDLLDIGFLQKYTVKPEKKRFFIFFKGKLYKFKSGHGNEACCKALNIKYCQIELISLQKQTQTVVFSGRHGQSTAGLNLEQCIIIRFLNKVVVLTNSVDANLQQRNQHNIKKWFELMKYFCVLVNVRCHYEIGQIIGKGNFAKVFEATHAAKKRKFALKTIQKTMFKDNIKSVLGLHDEINLLRKIRHPNVLQLYEIFESDNNIHLIIEHLNGKELFDQIKQRGQYQEQDAATILRCILNALVVLHSNNIVHRDLKPENLIFRDENLNSLVIIDFGLSTIIKDNQPLYTRCGSPGYVAPEILNNLGYGCKADIFSLGVIMYILLTSKFVFNARDYSDILRRNKQCKVYFPKKLWEKLSPEALNLCSLMLKKNADERISAKDALEHGWFKKFPERIASVDNASNPLRKDLFDDPNDVRWIEQDNINIYNQGDGLDVADSLNPPFDDEDSKEGTSQSNPHDNIQVSDLITSSPLMNKKKMQEHLKNINENQLEQEKQSLFTTPLPQMRFINRQRDQKVHTAFQGLLGRGIPRGPSAENKDKSKRDSSALPPPVPSNSKSTTLANSHGNSRETAEAKRNSNQVMVDQIPPHEKYMTPQVSTANQGAYRESEKFQRNQATLFKMTSVKVGDAQSSAANHAGDLSQAQQASQGESQSLHLGSQAPQQVQKDYFKSNLQNIEEAKEDNTSDVAQAHSGNRARASPAFEVQQFSQQDKKQVEFDGMHPSQNIVKQAKRKDGGTGGGGQSEDEDECIATFSSDEDDDTTGNKRYHQLPLSQKITKVWEHVNNGLVIERNKQVLLHQRVQQARNVAQNAQFQYLMSQNPKEGDMKNGQQMPMANPQHAVNLPSGIINQFLMSNVPQNQQHFGMNGDPNMWRSAMQIDQIGGPQGQMSSLQMGQETRAASNSTHARRGSAHCDMGPRKNRFGSDGAFSSFPVFLVDRTAQQSWPGRESFSVGIGPRRPGGVPTMDKEVIESMHKELPRSMTPDDSLFLEESHGDLQVDKSQVPQTFAQPAPQSLANAVHQQSKPLDLQQATNNSQALPQERQTVQSNADPKSAMGSASVSPSLNQSFNKQLAPPQHANNEGQPKRTQVQKKKVDAVRQRLKLI